MITDRETGAQQLEQADVEAEVDAFNSNAGPYWPIAHADFHHWGDFTIHYSDESGKVHEIYDDLDEAASFRQELDDAGPEGRQGILLSAREALAREKGVFA